MAARARGRPKNKELFAVHKQLIPLTKESVRPREGSPGGYGHPADKTHNEDKANEVTKVLPTTVNIAYASIAPPHPKPLQIAT